MFNLSSLYRSPVSVLSDLGHGDAVYLALVRLTQAIRDGSPIAIATALSEADRVVAGGGRREMIDTPGEYRT